VSPGRRVVGRSTIDVMGSKYHPLFERLCRSGDGPVDMSFEEIEALVGKLPASATTNATWWANESNSRHTQASAWLNAGREVEHVDRAQRRVRFGAAGWRRGA
jgi:hypothetical protein